ncbi:hypothetical protein [Viridibacillus arvi]|uniref:hypothetical protein n=1 Tax=Viridibacillus arvi TaxID=263475 RepID=UPI0034CDB430
MSAFTVELDNIGNIDQGQNPYEPVFGIPRGVEEVDTLEQASSACRKYIELHNLGGGNWIGGKVFDQSGTQVAYISYNGRIWSPDRSRELI